MTPLESCAESFAADLALARGLSPKTVEAYGRDVRAFLEFLAARGKTAPEALVRADVADHVGAMRAKGRKASTRARAFVAVREFLAYLASTRATAHDLSEGLEAPKKNLVLPRVLDEATTLKILQAANGSDPRDLRDRAMLEFLYGCGLRVRAWCVAVARGRRNASFRSAFPPRRRSRATSRRLANPSRAATRRSGASSSRGWGVPSRAWAFSRCCASVRPRRAWTRTRCRRTCCGTASRRIFLRTERTSGRYRKCSDTPRLRPLRCTRT